MPDKTDGPVIWKMMHMRHLISLSAAMLLLTHLRAEPSDIEALLATPFEDLLDVQIQTAGKRTEQLRDIPASVTIITRDEIARYGWQTLEELLRHAPGFFLLDNTEERFIGTRGAVGGGVQFLVNGVAQHPSRQKTLTVPEVARLNIPIEAIDRVEIIRGPMSVIYGNNAFLGVVNLVTNEIATHGSRASASLGTQGTGGLFGRVGDASGAAEWVLNIGARKDGGLSGDYADMMSSEQLAGLDPAMHKDMDGDMDRQDLSVEFSGALQDLQLDLRWTRSDFGLYALTPAFDEGTRVRLDTFHAALGWARRFGDRLGLRVTGIHSQEHYDAYQADFLFPDFDGDQKQRSTRSELELAVHWQPRRDLDALFGYRWLQISDVRNLVAFPPLIDSTDRLSDYSSQDLFAELSWQFRPRWRVLGGARLSILPDRYRWSRSNRGEGAQTTDEIRTDDNTELNGRFGLLWDLGPDQVVKLIWATATQDSGDVTFAELERINSIELNTVVTRPRWLLSASLFQNRIDNVARSIQLLDPTTGMYQSLDDNSGRWRSRGVELIAEARPLPSLDLSASLTWQQTRDQATRIDPGYSPEWLLKFKADYRVGAWTLAGSAYYVDAMEADWDFVSGPTERIVRRIGQRVPGYWNLGLNLRWDPAHDAAAGPYVQLHLTNLLNTENRDPANELTDLELGLIGPGRTMTATVGYAF